MTERDVSANYRPLIIWGMRKIVDPQGSFLVSLPLAVAAGFILMVAPARLRHVILFRKRNEITWQIARNAPSHIHFGAGKE